MIKNLTAVLACAALTFACSEARPQADGADAPPTEPPAATAEAALASEAPPGAVPDDLRGTSWALTAIDGGPAPEAGVRPTLEIFEDGAVAGSGGVNRFRTTVELGDGRLSFAPAAATKMAGPPQAMELEDRFFARLAAASAYEVDADTLRIWARGDESLTFSRSQPVED